MKCRTSEDLGARYRGWGKKGYKAKGDYGRVEDESKEEG